jgi:hypothetical protein
MGTDVALDAQSPRARESPANKYGSQTARLPIPTQMKQAHGRLPVGLEIGMPNRHPCMVYLQQLRPPLKPLKPPPDGV